MNTGGKWGPRAADLVLILAPAAVIALRTPRKPSALPADARAAATVVVVLLTSTWYLGRALGDVDPNLAVVLAIILFAALWDVGSAVRAAAFATVALAMSGSVPTAAAAGVLFPVVFALALSPLARALVRLRTRRASTVPA